MPDGGSRTQGGSLARLYELMRRVHSSPDTAQVLDEIARGVTEGLGYGIAAISRLEGDELVTTTFAGPERERPFVIGRRRPVRLILEEFVVGDEWGILRYVPRGRVSEEALEGMWIPDYEPLNLPDAWHPEDALYAPLYAATGELLGIMAVDLPPGGRIPDRQQRELLEMFVIQAGLALSNAQHRGRMAERVTVGEMLKQVALAGNLGDLDMVIQQAARGDPRAGRRPDVPALLPRESRRRRGARCRTSGSQPADLRHPGAARRHDPVAGDR